MSLPRSGEVQLPAGSGVEAIKFAIPTMSLPQSGEVQLPAGSGVEAIKFAIFPAPSSTALMLPMNSSARSVVDAMEVSAPSSMLPATGVKLAAGSGVDVTKILALSARTFLPTKPIVKTH